MLKMSSEHTELNLIGQITISLLLGQFKCSENKTNVMIVVTISR